MKDKIKIKSLELLFSYLLPVIFISIKYDLFVKSEATIKLTGVALILVVVFAVKFYTNICNFIKTIKKPDVRKAINIAKNIIVCFLLILLLEISKEHIANLEFIIISCGVSISIGNCFKEDFVELIKLDKKNERKQEIIEAYNEAIKK